MTWPTFVWLLIGAVALFVLMSAIGGTFGKLTP